MAFEFTTTALKTYPSAASSVSITPSGTAWVNSAWVQLVASTANAITIIAVTVDTGVAAQFEIDIGKGTAGSETVVGTLCGSAESVTVGAPCVLYFPIPISNIPSGTRVAVRLRKATGSTVAWAAALQYLDSATPTGITVTAQPSKVLPSAAAGAVITPAATAWVSSAWAQITASTAAAWVLAAATASLAAAQPFEFDIGVGTAGSEVVVTTLRGYVETQVGMPMVLLLEPVLDNIASGVRVAVRMRKPGTAVTTWNCKLTYYEKPL